ncbi:hypothetical protein IMPR6_100074 [Imperialibacter sp. EC-SDR9]|nr:hypothetical protein IMPERIA89_450119 [Imperialibacter sp. 89]CAD5292881.1 hypothetical protein IMPERIA75_650118 [Imperialibacter sp. 75]VVS99355.1 hypothetical protein IMPR6_100074 [Imperialibacter sp. EC-SDR9]
MSKISKKSVTSALIFNFIKTALLKPFNYMRHLFPASKYNFGQPGNAL